MHIHEQNNRIHAVPRQLHILYPCDVIYKNQTFHVFDFLDFLFFKENNKMSFFKQNLFCY